MSQSSIFGAFTRGQILSYLFMPQVMPRLQELLGTGFNNLALMIAMVYRSVNLIPATDPIFNPLSRNKLTIRQVIGLAASNLTFSRKHMDQVVIFFVIMIGMVLLTLQFVMTLAFLMINPALAAGGAAMPTTYGEFFQEPHANDLAYLMMYAVFGVPELFRETGQLSQFHTALHSLFQLYSVGLLVVAVIIVCYFIFAIVVETAQTGVPFGKRYNHVWTPIRLVFALGLLIPVGYGLNSAQWITLYTAKFGSDFATRGWTLFNDTMTGAYLEDVNERVGIPKNPNLKPLLAFMTTVQGCRFAYEEMYPLQADGEAGLDIQAYIITGATAENAGPTLLSGAGSVAGEEGEPPRDIHIRFGVYDTERFAEERGNVASYCGDIVIMRGDAFEEGALSIQDYYLTLVSDLWNGGSGLQDAAEAIVERNIRRGGQGAIPEPPAAGYKEAAIAENEGPLTEAIAAAALAQANSDTWEREQAYMFEFGWAGAGIWYNKIAQLNGSLVTAVNNVPQIIAYPMVLEYMQSQNFQQNREAPEVFSETMSDGRLIVYGNSADEVIGPAIKSVVDDWNTGMSYLNNVTGNWLIDTINLIFGTQGLFAMCQNTDVHPLAQLSQLGKGLVESSIRNVTGGLVMTGAQIIFPGVVGQVAGVASGILYSIASITIVMGFMLYYVLPFMPFLYFFFAAGGWIKGLFEAMVGVPLWALAHLRIDGEGLPGEPGMQGIYLLFEIFLRPILIVFGLLASVVIFAAMVKVLNETFFLVVSNVGGHDPNTTNLCGAGAGGGGGAGEPPADMGDATSFFRGPIDELFFTIMYAIVVYMIGMSCFKLIDLVPNNILRYMGAQVNSFNDKQADPAEGLGTRLSIGGSMVSGKILGDGGIVPSLGQGLSQTRQGVQELATPPPQQR